jgi:hypothetical protein
MGCGSSAAQNEPTRKNRDEYDELMGKNIPKVMMKHHLVPYRLLSQFADWKRSSFLSQHRRRGGVIHFSWSLGTRNSATQRSWPRSCVVAMTLARRSTKTCRSRPVNRRVILLHIDRQWLCLHEELLQEPFCFLQPKPWCGRKTNAADVLLYNRWGEVRIFPRWSSKYLKYTRLLAISLLKREQWKSSSMRNPSEPWRQETPSGK